MCDMKMPAAPLHIRAYFDFMCPWSYLGKARLENALHRTKTKYSIEWIPFELYTPSPHHEVDRTKIIGHEHLAQTYAQLHTLGAKENILILHPQYESSSRRALTGLLFAQKKGKADAYVNEMFAQTFEHTQNISSLAVLHRVAVKLGFNTHEFISFIEKKENQDEVVYLTERSKAEGVRGVPTYLIHHLPITGALEVSDLVHILSTLKAKTIPAYMVAEKKKTRTKKKMKKGTKKAVKGKTTKSAKSKR